MSDSQHQDGGKGMLRGAHAGPLLVAVAALLWGTDSVFRYPIAEALSPTFIVFSEHLLGVIALLPWVLLISYKSMPLKEGGRFKRLAALSKREWYAAAFVGILSSAIATTIFTLSFRYVNPSVAVLLQKLQPVMVVLGAMAFLGERPRRSFYLWGTVALVAGVVLSFPDLKLDLEVKRTIGVLYSLGAAIIWAASTVISKVLLERIPPTVGTFWRYVFGLATLSVMLAFPHEPIGIDVVSSWPVVQASLYISFISGIVPMSLYYGGLARTPAGIATFVELLYPISAVVLNALVLGMPLDEVQLAAGAVLIAAVTMISR